MADVPAEPRATSASSTASGEPSPFIRSAQRRYENTRERNAATIRKTTASRGERQAAHQSNAMNARLMAANLQVDMAMGQMQAAGDLFTAVVGLQDAIRQAMEIIAVQGVISRKYIELRSYMGLGQAAFRGDYFLWPFKDRGRGVTIVQLDTGKRFDLRFSPVIRPLEIFGFDMANFTVSPDGRSLAVVGVGMDTSKYVKQTKWDFLLPKSSILIYDISGFEFKDKSDLQVREESLRADEALQAEALAEKTAENYEILAVFLVAQIGNVEKMTEMLDAGVDPNIKHPNDTCGPLVFAVIGGQKEMVELLIERGANVNDITADGKTVLAYAEQFGNQEIVKILKDNGAK